MPAVDGVSHRWIDTGRLRMHVAEAGDPDAEPVMLVHGWPQHWYAWRKIIGQLAERYRVLCPDLRGFGWSDAPAGSYLKSELAADLLALLDALEIDRVRLAGHDWGGFAGYLLCLQAPERISHYLAAGINHPWVRAQPGVGPLLKRLRRISYMLAISTPLAGPQLVRRVPAFTRKVMELSAADPDATWSEDQLAEFVAQWSEPERAAATVGIYRSFLTRELPQLASGSFREQTLELPIVHLSGIADPVLRPADLGGFERRAPNMRLEIVPGAGHWLPEEAPGRVAEELLALYSV